MSDTEIDYHGIAAKIREQNPLPRMDMRPEQYYVAYAVDALARALESMPAKVSS